MPDISMCSGVDCPKRDTCFRAQAKPSAWQLWMNPPRLPDGSCTYYWPLEQKERHAD